jgi:uncharacterized protein (TIGR02118 family)
MIVVSVTYPATEGSRFDLDYYREKHVPLVRSRWGSCGLTDSKFIRGVGVPGGGPVAYHLTALLYFGSEAEFQGAGQQHGKEVMSDIKNFTDVKPIVQLNDQFG